MPKEVGLNRAFNYSIKVTNLTDATLTDIVITEEFPANFKFISATPTPKEDVNKLLWEIASLGPKARRASLAAFFEQRIPCVAVTRHKKIFPEIVEFSDQHKIPVFRCGMITKHFINSATIIMENLMAPRVRVQGTMLEIKGMGVLIEGKPGMGKSETALALVQKGYSLIADDLTILRRDSSGALIGSAPQVTQYHMEIKGLGIIHVPSLFGVSSVREEKRLDLVVTLCQPGEEPESEPMRAIGNLDIMGTVVPQVYLAVRTGRPLANVVETAALDQKLRRLGHDAIKELDESLLALAIGDKVGSD